MDALATGARYTHTNLIANDWKKLADFYCRVFGCVCVPPERNQSGDWLERGTKVPGAKLRGVHLRLPGHGESGPTIEVYTYSEVLPNSEAAANRAGYGHIAFAVNDVNQSVQAVFAAGGSRLGEIVSAQVQGAGRITFAYVRDPEGNIIELQHWESDRGGQTSTEAR
jgi:glyoxylase I family protein